MRISASSCVDAPHLASGGARVLVALGATAISDRLGWMRRHHRAVSTVTGAMLVLVGFLMITNTFVRLSTLFAPLSLWWGHAH